MKSRHLTNELISTFTPALRREAIFSVHKRNPKDSLMVLASTLKEDPSSVLRHEAAFLLGTLKNKKVISLLMYSIENDQSDLVRHEAIEALGDNGIMTKEIRDLLKKLLRDKNIFIRETAEIALGTLENVD